MPGPGGFHGGGHGGFHGGGHGGFHGGPGGFHGGPHMGGHHHHHHHPHGRPPMHGWGRRPYRGGCLGCMIPTLGIIAMVAALVLILLF